MRRGGAAPLALGFWFSGRAKDADVSGCSAHLQQGTAAVQTAFGSGRSCSRPVALGGDSQFWKIGLNAVSVGELDTGTHSDGNSRSYINGNVARRGFQHGIGSLASRNEAGDDPASARLCPRRRYSVEFNPSRAGFSANRAFGRSQANTSATGFRLEAPGNAVDENIAAVGFNFHRLHLPRNIDHKLP